MSGRENALRRRITRTGLLRTMFDEAGLGVAFVDLIDRRLLYANAEFADIVGYSVRELKGMTLFDLTHADDRGGDAASFERLLRGEIRKRAVEKRFVRKDGGLVWLRLKSTIVKVDGARVALTVVEDVSERKAAVARLAESEMRLRRSNEGKDVFLASLAHELRNPLSAIRNSVDVLDRLQISDDRLHVVIPILQRQSQQLSRLVDELLDTSRITTGKIVLDRATVALKDVLDRAIDGINPLLRGRSQALVVDMPAERYLVSGDIVRLTQVFANLLDNASKYTPEGGRVTITARRRLREVRVLVEDSGEGIAEDFLPHVFELFAQGIRPGRPVRGLGIGLTIVKRLVELHDGRIGVSSTPGKGSTFEVALPLEETSRMAAAEPPPDDPQIRPMRILVVDDDSDAAASLSMCLQMSGHTVRVAADGSEALKISCAFRPDVSLLDLDLPDMTGYELAGRLREQWESESGVFVALTGHARREHAVEPRTVKFSHFLLKPVTTGQLRAVLSAVPDNPGDNRT